MVKITLNFYISVIIFCVSLGACAKDCKQLPSSFNYTKFDSTVTLDLSEIASLPAQKVFVGGVYHDDANIIHPALYISENGGKDWIEKKLLFPELGVGSIQTYGIDRIWMLLDFQQEGQNFPKYLVSSSDTGKTWCAYSLEFIDFSDTELHSSGIQFYNQNNGLLWLQGSSGSYVVYSTDNGGKNWKKLFAGKKDHKYEIDTQYRYPNRQPPLPHSPLWSKDMDFYKISGLIRFKANNDRYTFQNFDYSKNAGWTDLSSIIRKRTISNNRLQ
jgi:hypothetical protein